MKDSVEKIVLDRFEYKLSKDMFVVYKKCIGSTYTLKHAPKYSFKSIEEMNEWVGGKLTERKRYLKLLKTLTPVELNKVFSDVVVLGLTPSQLKEYSEQEVYEYTVVVEDDWDCKTFTDLYDVKQYVADLIGLHFHLDYSLVDKDNNLSIRG